MTSPLGPQNFAKQITISQAGESVHVEIETKRLSIRSYDRERDFENTASICSNPQTTKHFFHGNPLSIAEVTTQVEKIGLQYFARGEPFGMFSIFEKETQRFVGHVDLVPDLDKAPGVAELGFILDQSQHGKGFATEASQAMVHDYLQELEKRGYTSNGAPIRRVFATAHPENIPSQKVLEKLAMVFEKSQERYGKPRNWYGLKV